MLDPPDTVPYNALNGTQAFSPEHQRIALETAEASMTLLKNDHGALPLSAHGTGTLAIVGPQAKMAGLLMGNYAESASNGNWGTDIYVFLTWA